MSLSFARLMPLVSKVGFYLKEGADHYADLRGAGVEAGPEVVSLYLNEKMKTWKPEVQGKELLDDPTRAAAARFLAGVAVNFVGE